MIGLSTRVDKPIDKSGCWLILINSRRLPKGKPSKLSFDLGPYETLSLKSQV